MAKGKRWGGVFVKTKCIAVIGICTSICNYIHLYDETKNCFGCDCFRPSHLLVSLLLSPPSVFGPKVAFNRYTWFKYGATSKLFSFQGNLTTQAEYYKMYLYHSMCLPLHIYLWWDVKSGYSKRWLQSIKYLFILFCQNDTWPLNYPLHKANFLLGYDKKVTRISCWRSLMLSKVKGILLWLIRATIGSD